MSEVLSEIRNIARRINESGYTFCIQNESALDLLCNIEPQKWSCYTNCPQEILLKKFPSIKISGKTIKFTDNISATTKRKPTYFSCEGILYYPITDTFKHDDVISEYDIANFYFRVIQTPTWSVIDEFEYRPFLYLKAAKIQAKYGFKPILKTKDVLGSDLYRTTFKNYRPEIFARDLANFARESCLLNIYKYIDYFVPGIIKDSLCDWSDGIYTNLSDEVIISLIIYKNAWYNFWLYSESSNTNPWYGKWNHIAIASIHNYCVKFGFSKKKTRQVVFAVKNLNRFIADSIKGEIRDSIYNHNDFGLTYSFAKSLATIFSDLNLAKKMDAAMDKSFENRWSQPCKSLRIKFQEGGFEDVRSTISKCCDIIDEKELNKKMLLINILNLKHPEWTVEELISAIK